MNPIAQLFRFVIMMFLALAGFAMAVILLASTAIALGVMYLVAKVRGRPFAPAAFWQARSSQMRWQFSQGRWRSPGQAGAAPQANGPESPTGGAPGPTPRTGGFRPQRDNQVIDVEVRDIR